MLLDLRAGRARTPQAPSPISVTQKVSQSEADVGKIVFEDKESSVCLWLPPLPLKYHPVWMVSCRGRKYV